MTESKTYNYIYKTINIINGKEYIGVHKTNKINDGYIGCGVYSQNGAKNINKTCKSAFVKAVLKYGYDNFIKEVLQFFDTYEEALEVEKNTVNLEYIKRKNNYNTAIGGVGGFNIASIKSFELIDFEGNIHTGENIKEFCRNKNLDDSSIYKLLLGYQQTSQGYRLKNDRARSILIFDLINNLSYKTYDLHIWCKNNLPKSIIKNEKTTNNMLYSVLKKYKCLYDNRWWCCYEDEYKDYIEIEASKIQNGFMYTVSYNNQLYKFTSITNFTKNSTLTRYGLNLLEKNTVENYKGYRLVSKEWIFKDIDKKYDEWKPLPHKKSDVKNKRKGVPLTEEHKKAIGDGNRGKKRAPLTKQQIENRRKAQEGKVTEWTFKEVIDTSTSIAYKNLKIACKELGFSNYNTIKAYLSGKRTNKTTLLYTGVFK